MVSLPRMRFTLTSHQGLIGAINVLANMTFSRTAPAIAREFGMTVATRNVRHFPFCQVENPFELKDPPVQPGS